MDTLYLVPGEWDLTLDAFGNIAMASAPYALAQDVASAIRLFLGELQYDTAKGVPYFEEILGQLPPPSLLMAHLEAAALTVPGVVEAQCIISSITDREVVGQVQFIDDSGAINSVNF